MWYGALMCDRAYVVRPVGFELFILFGSLLAGDSNSIYLKFKFIFQAWSRLCYNIITGIIEHDHKRGF